MAGGFYNSSSTKLSSSSTLPSFSDPPLREVPLHNNNNSNDIPVPQIPESTFSLTQSIRSAGRTFSLGSKAPKWTAPKENQHASVRERTLTASTSSTTTPPKLPSTVDLGGNDYFGNMFDKIGSRTHDEESKSTGSSPGSGVCSLSSGFFLLYSFLTWIATDVYLGTGI